MTFTDLKQNLITNYNFIDNSYLDDYINLILNADLISGGYREYHHLIPVVFYKEKYKLSNREEAEKIANEDANNILVHLLYKDHCRAHYYLYFCTFGASKYQNAAAFISMIRATKRNTRNELPVLSEADYDELQLCADSIRNDPNSKYFSDSEIKFLVENVKDLGTTKCAEILKRPRTVVSKLSVSLGLIESSGPRINWTNAEKLWLKENIKKYSRKDCAEILGKSEASIHAMEQRLGISGSRISSIKWTEAEDTWLLNNYKIMERQDLVSHLNRSEDAIKARLKLLGVKDTKLLGKPAKYQMSKKYKLWTAEEKAWLEANWQQLTVRDCAKFLNRNESSVEHAIKRFNLNK